MLLIRTVVVTWPVGGDHGQSDISTSRNDRGLDVRELAVDAGLKGGGHWVEGISKYQQEAEKEIVLTRENFTSML